MDNENISNINEHSVFVFDAEAGMVLSRNVLDSTGHLIAAKETELTMNMIAKISNYNILEIYVYDENTEIEEVVALQSDEDQKTYYEKIRQSETFKEFNESYSNNVDDIKSQLNAVMMRDEEIDVDKLINGTSDILSKYNNTLQVFDMLHCMRELDDLTFVHCVNVSLIASIIAKWAGFSEEDVKFITIGGLLHDIGKLMIPKEILTKPDRLTANEYEIMKQHVNLGYQKIKDSNVDEKVKSIVLLHHEKCDGTGYPFGLKGNDIPEFVKIITIADIYDAMTANRVYRSAICPFTVIKIMEADAFTKYEPRFIIPFLKNVASSYIGSNVKLSDGRTGEVIMLNERELSCPIVRIDKDEFVDLSKEKDIQITALI